MEQKDLDIIDLYPVDVSEITDLQKKIQDILGVDDFTSKKILEAFFYAFRYALLNYTYVYFNKYVRFCRFKKVIRCKLLTNFQDIKNE